MTGRIDHLVITAGTLDEAVDHGTEVLGAAPGPVGIHAAMGTHNRLWSLGRDLYMEAIAPDPEAPAPGRARWFGLDGPVGAARLSHWALRVPDLDAALALAPEGAGVPLELSRGDYRWRIAVPEDGQHLYGGLFPALIEWQSEPPAAALPDIGARLVSLVISHPQAGLLGWAISSLTEDDRVIVREGPAGLMALVHTAQGERELR